MGGVDPAGDAGGVLAALLGDAGYPAGRLIMMLRVTFTGVSSPPDAGDGGTNDATASPAGSARYTKPVGFEGNSTQADSGTGVIAFLPSALTIDLDRGGARDLLAEATEASVRAGSRDGVIPQLVEETHPSPS